MHLVNAYLKWYVIRFCWCVPHFFWFKITDSSCLQTFTHNILFESFIFVINITTWLVVVWQKICASFQPIIPFFYGWKATNKPHKQTIHRTLKCHQPPDVLNRTYICGWKYKVKGFTIYVRLWWHFALKHYDLPFVRVIFFFVPFTCIAMFSQVS